MDGHAKDTGNQFVPLSDPRAFKYDKSRIAGIKPGPSALKFYADGSESCYGA